MPQETAAKAAPRADVSGDQHAHYRALDGLRGLALLGVVYFHVAYVLGELPKPLHMDLPFSSFGATGVDLFFVLSGFLITNILIRARNAGNYFRAFYARRALRLAPLYYLGLTLFFMLPLVRADAPHYPFTTQIWYWLDLSNLPISLGKGLIAPLSPFWTLAIEEQFYLLWPFIVLKCSNRALLRICCAIILSGALLRSLPPVQHFDRGLTGLFCSRFTLLHWEGLFGGAAVAILIAEGRLKRSHLPLLRVSLLPLLFVSYELCRRFLHPISVAFNATSYMLLYTVMVSWLVLSGHDALGARVFRAAPLRLVGRYSYCMYVIHIQLLLWAVPAVFAHARNRMLLAGECLLYVLAITAVAALSWRFMEEPILSLKRRFAYRNRPVPA